jgi:hypothetical protein
MGSARRQLAEKLKTAIMDVFLDNNQTTAVIDTIHLLQCVKSFVITTYGDKVWKLGVTAVQPALGQRLPKLETVHLRKASK